MTSMIFVKKLISSKLVLGAFLAVGVALVAVPAYAHFMYEHGITSEEDEHCTWNRAEISHGSGGGYAESKVKSRRGLCGLSWDRPIGHLKVKWKLLKKDGSSWPVCHSSSNYYNGTTASQMTVGNDYGSTPHCGNGVYKTRAYGYLKNSGTWWGGEIESGVTGHTLP